MNLTIVSEAYRYYISALDEHERFAWINILCREIG